MHYEDMSGADNTHFRHMHMHTHTPRARVRRHMFMAYGIRSVARLEGLRATCACVWLGDASTREEWMSYELLGAMYEMMRVRNKVSNFPFATHANTLFRVTSS